MQHDPRANGKYAIVCGLTLLVIVMYALIDLNWRVSDLEHKLTKQLAPTVSSDGDYSFQPVKASQESSKMTAIQTISTRDCIDCSAKWFAVGATSAADLTVWNQWWDIRNSCHSWEEDDNAKRDCVVGAVTTGVAAMGNLLMGIIAIRSITYWYRTFNNGVVKRDEIELEGLIAEFQAQSNITVLSVESPSPQRLVSREDQNTTYLSSPGMVLKYPNGEVYSTFFNFKEDIGNNTVHIEMYPPVNGTDIAGLNKREEYGGQAFTTGGVSFIMDTNRNEGGQLSTSYDYGTLDHQLSCYMWNEFNANGHWIQIYDENNDGTIGGLLACPSRWHNDEKDLCRFSDVNNIPSPVNTRCECISVS